MYQVDSAQVVLLFGDNLVVFFSHAFFSSKKKLFPSCIFFQGFSWVVPPPSNSDHQDYYIFSRGSQPKPSFPLLLGGGTTQGFSSRHICQPLAVHSWFTPVVFFSFQLGFAARRNNFWVPWMVLKPSDLDCVTLWASNWRTWMDESQWLKWIFAKTEKFIWRSNHNHVVINISSCIYIYICIYFRENCIFLCMIWRKILYPNMFYRVYKAYFLWHLIKCHIWYFAHLLQKMSNELRPDRCLEISPEFLWNLESPGQPKTVTAQRFGWSQVNVQTQLGPTFWAKFKQEPPAACRSGGTCEFQKKIYFRSKLKPSMFSWEPKGTPPKATPPKK